MPTKSPSPPKEISAKKLAQAAKKAQQPSFESKGTLPAPLPALRDNGALAVMINKIIDDKWAKEPHIPEETISHWSESDFAAAWGWAAAMRCWLDESDLPEEYFDVPDVIVRANIATQDMAPKLGKDGGVLPRTVSAPSNETAPESAPVDTISLNGGTPVPLDAAIAAGKAMDDIAAERAAAPSKQYPSETADAIMNSEKMKTALKVADIKEWPEGATYHEARQPTAIMKVLIGRLHRHLEGRNVVCLFRQKMQTHDRTIGGKASKAGAKLKFFDDMDFCIDVNFEQWQRYTPEQRVALIDHELCHFGIEQTDKGDALVLISHDIEEFRAIVSRWGLWKPDVREFAETVRSKQVDMFKPEAAK